MINIFIFRCAGTETWDYFYYFVDRPAQYNSPDCPYNNKISYFRLMIVLVLE